MRRPLRTPRRLRGPSVTYGGIDEQNSITVPGIDALEGKPVAPPPSAFVAGWGELARLPRVVQSFGEAIEDNLVRIARSLEHLVMQNEEERNRRQILAVEDRRRRNRAARRRKR